MDEWRVMISVNPSGIEAFEMRDHWVSGKWVLAARIPCKSDADFAAAWRFMALRYCDRDDLVSFQVRGMF